MTISCHCIHDAAKTLPGYEDEAPGGDKNMLPDRGTLY